MIVQRPDIKVTRTLSDDWYYKVTTIGGKTIPLGRSIYLSKEGKLGYYSKSYNKVVHYSKYNGIIKVSMKETVFEIFEKELVFNSQADTFYHSSKKIPDKNIEIEVGKEFITENNGHVKIVAFEKIGVYAQEDQWIGLLTRPESKIDGAIRFNLLGQVLSHGKDPNYNLKQEKPKSHITKTLIFKDTNNIIQAWGFNSSNFHVLENHIRNLKKTNTEYKVITNEVEL